MDSSPGHSDARPCGGAAATWSIAEVARDTGLGKDTLRVWERRYGFPLPSRDGLGERVYSAEQVRRLRLAKRLLDAGHRPGGVVPLSFDQLQALVDGLPASGHDPAGLAGNSAQPGGHPLHDPATPWLRWLAEDHIDAVRQGLQQQLVRRGLGTVVEELVAPLCVHVGEAWLRGDLSVYQEHLFTEVVQSVLREAIASIDAGGQSLRQPPRVLLTTAPTEQHGLGLLMAECYLALESCTRYSLGVSIPIADIVQAVRQLRIDVLALSFSAHANRGEVVSSLQQLDEQLPPGVAIWVGGASAGLRSRVLPARVSVVRRATDVTERVKDWRLRHPAGT